MYATNQVYGAFPVVTDQLQINHCSQVLQVPPAHTNFWHQGYTAITPSAPWGPQHANDSTSWNTVQNDPHSVITADYEHGCPNFCPRHGGGYVSATYSSDEQVPPMSQLCSQSLHIAQPAHQMGSFIPRSGSGELGYTAPTMGFDQQAHPASQMLSYNPSAVNSSANDDSYYMISTPSTQSSASPASLSLSYTSPSPTLSHSSTGQKVKSSPQQLAQQPAAGVYVCNHCDKRFSRPYNLKSHMRTHTKERPYVCTHIGCTWKFVRPHDLKRHQLLHSGHKPHVCSNCRKRFARSDALKRHLKVDVLCARAVPVSGNDQKQ